MSKFCRRPRGRMLVEGRNEERETHQTKQSMQIQMQSYKSLTSQTNKTKLMSMLPHDSGLGINFD